MQIQFGERPPSPALFSPCCSLFKTQPQVIEQSMFLLLLGLCKSRLTLSRPPCLVFFSDEVSSLARDCGMRLYQTSAKENLNVCNVFLHLAENYVNQEKSRAMAAAAAAAAMHSSR